MKIALIGYSGSGKSTLARALGARQYCISTGCILTRAGRL